MTTIPATNVISPRDCISNIRVIFDGGDGSLTSRGAYSIAQLDWKGKNCYAIRWNVAHREWNDPEKISGKKTCVGMPSSRGYPVWFILPDDFVKREKDISGLFQ
jgi:hypothetical protein